ncbi:MAG: hypothetical protein JXQ87_19075 [Bacteroidia bacterium]
MRVALVIMAILYSKAVLCQNSIVKHKKDSLWQIWSDIRQPAKERSHALQTFYNTDSLSIDSLRYYQFKLIEFSKSNLLYESLGDAYFEIAKSFIGQGNIEQYSKYSFLSIEAYENCVNKKEGLSFAKYVLEDLFREGKQGKTLQKALSITAAINNKELLELKAGYHNLCGRLISAVNKQKAISHFSKASDIYISLNDSINYSINLVMQGNLYLASNILDSANHFFSKHREINIALNRSMGISSAYYKLSLVQLKLDDPNLAMHYIDSAINVAESHKRVYLSIFYRQKGEIALINNNYGLARDFCMKAYAIENSARLKIRVCECLVASYEGLGQLDTAFAFQKEFIQLKDKFNQTELRSVNAKMQLRNTITKDSLRRAKIIKYSSAKLVRRNTIQYSLVVIVVLLLATVIAIATKFKISPRLASGLIFIFFILLFEFLLVVLDPWVDSVSNGEVGWKIGINTVIALMLFGIHQASEKRLKNLILKIDNV